MLKAPYYIYIYIYVYKYLYTLYIIDFIMTNVTKSISPPHIDFCRPFLHVAQPGGKFVLRPGAVVTYSLSYMSD